MGLMRDDIKSVMQMSVCIVGGWGTQLQIAVQMILGVNYKTFVRSLAIQQTSYGKV